MHSSSRATVHVCGRCGNPSVTLGESRRLACGLARALAQGWHTAHTSHCHTADCAIRHTPSPIYNITASSSDKNSGSAGQRAHAAARDTPRPAVPSYTAIPSDACAINITDELDARLCRAPPDN
ncbi:hypothetical protein EVAR_82560_1 [Eumeta japonica]|uniref:Uncharacterized protein n=1 Tax=Eumeta variegata TaxID=151549 RepID=A0A4C1UWK5_EUMVA|nr:hypothetical protein EVAR_82560_1 [Eumeta japonica]